MTDPARTLTPEQLTELGPLAAVIADKISSVPVRHCLGGTDQLVTELTLAVAVYVGRHVLPAEALALANPPRPAEHTWQVETRFNDGPWYSYGAPWPDRADAEQDFADTVAAASKRTQQRSREYRLTRTTTVYAVEAEHRGEPSC